MVYIIVTEKGLKKIRKKVKKANMLKKENIRPIKSSRVKESFPKMPKFK